jgi:hypothetical protein
MWKINSQIIFIIREQILYTASRKKESFLCFSTLKVGEEML